MNQTIESARETFRKLAVFEIDPKGILPGEASSNASALLQATDIIDDIYWCQTVLGGDYDSLLDQIGDDEELREMFFFYRGPYDLFNNNVPFLSVGVKPQGAAFYPLDLTREEFEAYIRKHQDLRSAFESPYTVVTRSNSHLRAIPYHVAYGELISRVSELLTSASHVEPHRGFRGFLSQRAKDLTSDDYYLSETLWVQLDDNQIDIAIGPYEVYDDQLAGLKAAYEAILFERDLEESARILHLQSELAHLCKLMEPELGLSLDVEHTNMKLSIANLLYAGGDARKAVPAIAFSLPNDERVIEEVGSRQIILKNVLEAKFSFVAQKITNRLLQERIQDEKTALRNFIDHTIFHEISHSIGPKRIVIGSEETTVNRCLRQYHSVLEEAKADALGACLALTGPRETDQDLFLSGYVGQFIRSIRFGIEDAHGGANAIQFNYLLKQCGFRIEDSTRTISIDSSRARQAIFNLAAEIIAIQERGDFKAARQFVSDHCVVSQPIERLINAVSDLPIDIRIRYLDWGS